MKERANTEIRQFLKEHNIAQWELGEMIGVSEMTIIRWLRIELPEEKKQEIMQVILDHEKEGDR